MLHPEDAASALTFGSSAQIDFVSRAARPDNRNGAQLAKLIGVLDRLNFSHLGCLIRALSP